MTAEEMAVDGYYVGTGKAEQEWKQGWKFLTLSENYGVSEATWEPMSGSSHPTEVSTLSFVPTSLRTTRDSF